MRAINHQACEHNKASIRRFIEMAWNRGDIETVDELIAADYVGHSPSSLTPVLGPEGVQRQIAQCRLAIPDLYVKIDGMIAEEDQVAITWRAAGTYDGRSRSHPLDGRVRYTGMSLVRLLAGRQVEARSVWPRNPA